MSDGRHIATADIGGTNARFAIAKVECGVVRSLDHSEAYSVSAHDSLASAWEQFRRDCPVALPLEAGFAVACPMFGEVLHFTNSSWSFNPATVAQELGLDRLTLVNDFGAVAHAVHNSAPADFAPICGPDTGLPNSGAISIIGPGTGLGVAVLNRRSGGYDVVETEGSHMSFAPLDEVDDRLLQMLRQRHTRVSIERVLSGEGLQAIYRVICAMEQVAAQKLPDAALWTLALSDDDLCAQKALDHFCGTLGAVAGDYALAHGAKALVVAGGLGRRIGARLGPGNFGAKFTFKGRYQAMLEAVPAFRIVLDEPGLIGAAYAFIEEHER